MTRRWQRQRGGWLLAAGGCLLAWGIVVAQESPSTGPTQPEGASIGELEARKTIIENGLPERVPVRPDDPDSAVWEVNPHVAFAQAQRLQRPLLLLFTGDWNAKCLKLSEEVFTTKSFNDFAKENAVICFLNYPRNRTDAAPSLRRWKEQFKVMGYPNLLVFDPEGNVVQEITGYKTGRPVTYFNELKGIVLPLVASIEERKNEFRKKGFRDWKNQEDVALFARFVRRGGDLVTLQGVNLETWTIEVSMLSDEDQELVNSFPAIEEIAKSRETPTP